MRALTVALATLILALGASLVHAGTRTDSGPSNPSAVLDTAQVERG